MLIVTLKRFTLLPIRISSFSCWFIDLVYEISVFYAAFLPFFATQ